MIELEQVAKTYGRGATRVEALRDVTLRIDAGQFVSIMGPSGSGKSTLLNLIAALDLPTSGRITIAGQPLAALDDDGLTHFRRRTVGLVFQFFNLLPTLSALENVLLPVMLDRRPTAADRDGAAALLAEVGLAARGHHQLHELSGGELQRVALARALVRAPRLLLADEPTGNLDSTTGRTILALLRRTAAAHGTTVVMVTHDAASAAFGDRIVRLHDGRLVADEPVSAAARDAAGEAT